MFISRKRLEKIEARLDYLERDTQICHITSPYGRAQEQACISVKEVVMLVAKKVGISFVSRGSRGPQMILKHDDQGGAGGTD